MMKTLDEDNDGDVTFSEWEKKIPAELKAVLNKLGPKLLEQGSGGVGKRGGARMQVSEREKELRRFEAEMAAKKAAQRKDGVVGERTAAAHTGRRGLSSIFEELDHDNSGSLTVRELRHAFAALGMSPEERHSIQAVLADMDTDGECCQHAFAVASVVVATAPAAPAAPAVPAAFAQPCAAGLWSTHGSNHGPTTRFIISCG